MGKGRSELKLVLMVVIMLSGLSSYADDRNVVLREDFSNLDNWKPLYFPKIKAHSTYSIVSEEGNDVLRAESNHSASGIVYRQTFNVYEYPLMKWRWKVEGIYAQGDATSKAGDDYPIRIYIMFQYDPKRVGFIEKVKYNSAKLLYGEYPPESSINYIWSSKEHPEAILSSPYTERSKMVLVDKGAKDLGTWVTHEINILEDYQKVFGKKPPATASIAIMNDSDNTGERSVSYVDYIELVRQGNDGKV
jgi:hypothetical protein